MTTMAGPRKVSIHDYPEHLNPFREEDNHSKIRFWTIGRKLSRSNSITFSGIKDLKNSWSLRSFMKKGKKGEQTSSQSNKSKNLVNGDSSPIVYRRALQYSSGSTAARSTVGSPERADRYVYGGSVTPLPRSRFQERLRSSQPEVNSPSATPRMARSDITGSRLSVASTNPFDEAPIPPVRASRRKKNRAPAPPPTNVDESVNKNLELRITESEDKKSNLPVEDDIDELNLKVELKIVEDEEKPITNPDNDDNTSKLKIDVSENSTKDPETENNETKELNDIEMKDLEVENIVIGSNSETDTSAEISFPKVDITKYRRNSSVNEDEIRLRRGNLEDFHSLANKRSKSMSNTLDSSYVDYHININESKHFDINSNEEPQKVVCKVYEDDSRKKSIDNSISSTEKDFLEIDKATRELEREISKLNSALIEDDFTFDHSRLSVSEIRQKFDKPDTNSPNPIPKPRRSHYGETISHANVNGNIPT